MLGNDESKNWMDFPEVFFYSVFGCVYVWCLIFILIPYDITDIHNMFILQDVSTNSSRALL